MMKLQSKILITCFLMLSLLAASTLHGQNYRNGHPFDFKRFNLGFLMGFTYNSYNLKEQVNIVENGVTLNRIDMVPRPGLNLGMISNVKINNQLAFRFIPQISIEQRDFLYYFEDQPEPETRKIEAAYLDMPAMLQIKTAFFKRTRVYVLAGANMGVNLSGNKRVEDDPTLLKINNTNYTLAFGFGINLYGDRVKLSPEIVYKLGLGDIFVPEFTTHALAISRLSSQVIAINFNFE